MGACAGSSVYAIEAGADGVVFPGVASEFDFLTAEERTRALEVVAETVAGRLPIVVGASAPTAGEAGALAREGAARGAAAAMVMAPAAVGSEAGALVRFFEAVVAEAGIPIVLQNAPPPVGAGLPVETTLEVAARVPGIRFVKEETLPCGQRITRLIEGAPSTLEGVIGGAGGRYIVDELNRGAAGTMPAAELTEAHVALRSGAPGGRPGTCAHDLQPHPAPPELSGRLSDADDQGRARRARDFRDGAVPGAWTRSRRRRPPRAERHAGGGD